MTMLVLLFSLGFERHARRGAGAWGRSQEEQGGERGDTGLGYTLFIASDGPLPAFSPEQSR